MQQYCEYILYGSICPELQVVSTFNHTIDKNAKGR
jgi:hypothetical protein